MIYCSERSTQRGVRFRWSGCEVSEPGPGALRIKVTGGGDGSGAVTVDIVESTEGLNTYLIADDDGVFEPQRTVTGPCG